MMASPWADYVPPPRPDEDADDDATPFEVGPGLLPYDLGRRGFWALEPGQPVQMELAVDDIAGALIVREAPLGMLGTFELQVAIALAAVWGDDERERVFPFRIADLVERLELSWSGRTVADLDRALGRLASTLFAATWYDPARELEHDDRFSLLDSYRLSGRRKGRRTLGEVEWSRWTFARLEAQAFGEIDLPTMRRLGSPLARRLYAYCESRSGTASYVHDDGQPVETFVRRVDERFQTTLGSRAAQVRDFRLDLRRAGADVAENDRRYRQLEVVSGRQRGAHVLRVERLRSFD